MLKYESKIGNKLTFITSVYEFDYLKLFNQSALP